MQEKLMRGRADEGEWVEKSGEMQVPRVEKDQRKWEERDEGCVE